MLENMIIYLLFCFFAQGTIFVFILLSEGLLQNRITFKIATLFISPQLCKASILVPACSSGSRFPQKRPLGLDRDDIWPSRRSAGHLGQSPPNTGHVISYEFVTKYCKGTGGAGRGLACGGGGLWGVILNFCPSRSLSVSFSKDLIRNFVATLLS